MKKLFTILSLSLAITFGLAIFATGGGGGKTAVEEWDIHPYHEPLVGGNPKVTFHDDAEKTVTLENRGAIVSKADLSTFHFECDWWWLKGGETNGVKYWDVLNICFHSTGKLNKEWPHEIVEGIMLSINPAAETVSLFAWEDGKITQVLATKKVGPIKKDESYAFYIDCNTDFATVTMDEDVLFTQKWLHGAVPLPLLKSKGKKMVIYNREGAAGHHQKSQLWNLFFALNAPEPIPCPLPPPMMAMRSVSKHSLR